MNERLRHRGSHNLQRGGRLSRRTLTPTSSELNPSSKTLIPVPVKVETFRKEGFVAWGSR